MKTYLQAQARGSGLGVAIPVEILEVEKLLIGGKRSATTAAYYNARRMVRVRLPWGEETEYQARDLVTADGGTVDLCAYPDTLR